MVGGFFMGLIKRKYNNQGIPACPIYDKQKHNTFGNILDKIQLKQKFLIFQKNILSCGKYQNNSVIEIGIPARQFISLLNLIFHKDGRLG